MGTYIIIGGDGKEYGPISAEDLRQWFVEGRLNAKTLVKATSDAEFRPLEKFPEFADLPGPSAPEPASPAANANALSADYELDLGGCISAGWELSKKNFGTAFGAALVFIAIKFTVASIINLALVTALTKIFTSAGATVALGFLVIALNAPLIGPLMGGVYVVYLRLLRGQPTNLGEMFAGFQKCWSALFLGFLLLELAAALCMAPASYVIAERTNPIVHQLQDLQAQSQSTNPNEVLKLLSQMGSAYVSALPILLVCLIPMTYLSTCWLFTLPLIIDKQLSLGVALKTSWQQVSRHWWQVFGLTMLAYLIVLLGVLGCWVGILFTIPIGIAMLVCGYETIFNPKAP